MSNNRKGKVLHIENTKVAYYFVFESERNRWHIEVESITDKPFTHDMQYDTIYIPMSLEKVIFVKDARIYDEQRAEFTELKKPDGTPLYSQKLYISGKDFSMMNMSEYQLLKKATK